MSFGRVIAGEYVPVILFLFDVWPSCALAIIVLAAVFIFGRICLLGTYGISVRQVIPRGVVTCESDWLVNLGNGVCSLINYR